jgi:CHAT domain-containing protein
LFTAYCTAQNLDEINGKAREYFSKGEYEKALPWTQMIADSAKKAFGSNHPAYANCLINLGILYANLQRNDKAEAAYLEANRIFKLDVVANEKGYIKSLNFLATFYHKVQKFEKAESIFSEIKNYNLKRFGQNSEEYATTLTLMAKMYMDWQHYPAAETIFLQVKDIRKNLLGTNHIYYAYTVDDLGNLYREMGKHKEAEYYCLEAIRVWKVYGNERIKEQAKTLNVLALTYNDMGQLVKALNSALVSLDYSGKSNGEMSVDYASCLNTLAMVYQGLARYKDAEESFIKSMSLRKKLLGENHLHYTTSLNNLASLYLEEGVYEKAEPLYIQAKEIRKKVLGENSMPYAVSLANLGYLYMELGLMEKATPLILQSRDIMGRVLGRQHPDYAFRLLDLVTIYNATGNSKEAEKLCLQGIDILRKANGENHIYVLNALNRLSITYFRMKDYTRAAQIGEEVVTKAKNILGDTHPNYFSSIGALAVTNLTAGNYQKAEKLFSEVLNNGKKYLGEQHPVYINSLIYAPFLYASMGNHVRAEALLIEGSQYLKQNAINTFATLSEKEKRNFLQRDINGGNLNFANSILFYHKSPSLVKQNFNQLLFLKSLTLSDTKDVLVSLRNSRDLNHRKLFASWQNNKALLAKQYSLPLNARLPDLKKLEDETESLEKELNRLSTEFHQQQASLKISLEDVTKNLQQGEAAIEFVRFRLYNKKFTDSIMYGAYLVKGGDAMPQFISLCEEKQLTAILYPKNVSDATIKAIYRSTITGKEQKAVLGDSLYNLLWKPLLPYLDGIKKIDYSPAGILYKLAFHALPSGNAQLLLDKYELNQYTSIREVAFRQPFKKIDPSIALFGDAAFTMDSITLVRNVAAHENEGVFFSDNSRSDNKEAWINLPGTGKEIMDIRNLFQNNRISTNFYTGEKATEDQFKSLNNNSPRIIHLATHGFFLPVEENKGFSTEDKNAFAVASDPMLRSGIILAGANRVWSGKSPIKEREDGIITAYEISQLDLRKTDLVVLSACETALGDVNGTEGVFGLQRAFKLAGVNNMLLSLWRVPDAETAELMTVFYKYFLEDKSPREALNDAQKDMRKKYAPYYWAAFVLIE